jgi:hypothetical protein
MFLLSGFCAFGAKLCVQFERHTQWKLTLYQIISNPTVGNLSKYFFTGWKLSWITVNLEIYHPVLLQG